MFERATPGLGASAPQPKTADHANSERWLMYGARYRLGAVETCVHGNAFAGCIAAGKRTTAEHEPPELEQGIPRVLLRASVSWCLETLVGKQLRCVCAT
jgi:hypothetical protein